MRRMIVALLSVVAACSSGTEPLDEVVLTFESAQARQVGPDDTVEFTRGPYGDAEWDLREFEVVTDGESIHVFGAWASGCHPAGSVDRSNSTLVIRIQGTVERPAVCLGASRPWNYHALLTRVEPGEYAIVVEHDNDGLHPVGGVVYQARATVE